MRKLQVAFVDQHVVTADYVKEDGEVGVRRLEPHALIINAPAWYLIAYDYLRGDQRTFRLDRFVSVEIQGETFTPRPRDIMAGILSSTGVTMNRV
jgi:predicted DNA-binding transcriptional regulator YafY